MKFVFLFFYKKIPSKLKFELVKNSIKQLDTILGKFENGFKQ